MSPAASALSLAGDYVREAVNARRAAGMKRAVAEVARMLGLSERRCRAFVHGEARQLLADEWEMIRARREREIATRIARMELDAAALRSRLAEWPR